MNKREWKRVKRDGISAYRDAAAAMVEAKKTNNLSGYLWSKTVKRSALEAVHTAMRRLGEIAE